MKALISNEEEVGFLFRRKGNKLYISIPKIYRKVSDSIKYTDLFHCIQNPK